MPILLRRDDLVSVSLLNGLFKLYTGYKHCSVFMIVDTLLWHNSFKRNQKQTSVSCSILMHMYHRDSAHNRF